MADTSTELEIGSEPNPDKDEGMPPPAEGAAAPEGDSAEGEPTDAPDSPDVVEEHSPSGNDDSEPLESSESADTPELSNQLDSPEEAEKGEESDVAEQESSAPDESETSEEPEEDEEAENEPLESDPTETQGITDDQDAAHETTPPSTVCTAILFHSTQLIEATSK